MMLNLQTGVSKPISAVHDQNRDSVDADGYMHERVHADAARHAHSHQREHSLADGSAHGHEHVHAGGAWHAHSHDHDQEPSRARTVRSGHGANLEMEVRILAKNDALAARNRAWLAGREILALNLVSSPGSGKTTLLERTIARLAGELSLFVIEGDQATANDGERIREAGAPVVQVNTGAGCHLDAEMTRRGLAELKPKAGAVVFIENVGNLVCPALFDLGERAKIVIFSVTEGEDKPLKYPHMFAAAEVVLLNKTDLLPYLDFSVPDALANVRRSNPKATTYEVSARTGEGLEAWFRWIRAEVNAAREAALS
jgi:hydrogenase nickel incorporation protein HypB